MLTVLCATQKEQLNPTLTALPLHLFHISDNVVILLYRTRDILNS